MIARVQSYTEVYTDNIQLGNELFLVEAVSGQHHHSFNG